MSEKPEISSLFDLEFHESASTENGWSILRVPGGWIYTSSSFGGCCFVPEPPTQFEEQEIEPDETDREVIEILNSLVSAGFETPEFNIKANKIIRVLLRRSRKPEEES